RPFIDLETTYPDDRVLDQVPRKLVKRHGILPLFIDDDVVLIAATDEPDHELEDEFRLRFGKPMRAVIATPLQINQGIAKYYAPGARDEAAAVEVSSSSGGKKKKNSNTGSASANAPELTEKQKQEKKMVGLIILLWSFIGSALIDQFVIKPYLFPRWSFFVGVIFIIPPIVFSMVYPKYLKDK
ncbi:MAG: general secretion pathway protein GspE, partial [Planctomycetaceae bacterium]|nr:general secretion pathway protein GspE [Planctomycetaceae bacterium]